MPALKAFGRRWPFGSDDLVFPGILSAFVRLLVTIIVIGFAWKFQVEYSNICNANAYMLSYISVLLLLNIISIVIDSLLAYFSSRGSINYSSPRRHVSSILHLRLVLLIIEVIGTICGSFFIWKAFHGIKACSINNLTAMLWMCVSINVVSWLLWILFTVSALVYFDPLRLYRTPFTKADFGITSKAKGKSLFDETVNLLHSEIDEHVIHYNKKVWQHRISVFFCCMGRTSDQDMHHTAYSDLARVLATLLSDLKDAVPSDIATGLALLQREQLDLENHGIDPGRLRRTMEHLREHNDIDNIDRLMTSILHDELISLDYKHQEDSHAIENIVHYFNYACAVYGWPYFIYANPMCWHYMLCKQRKATPQLSKPVFLSENETVTGDNSCFCNFRSLLIMSELKLEDVIYTSFENDVYQLPFFVALDHSRAAVVISCRGTLSLKDTITDISATHQALQLEGFSEEFYAHKGILLCANKIKSKLIAAEILKTTFRNYPDYTLVLVGHSLGAGCAAILSILLHTNYPRIKCYSYAPPGCLLSKQAYEYSKGFITTVIMGKDIIPRLSVQNGHELKSSLLRLIVQEKKPKYVILLRNILENLGLCRQRTSTYPELQRRLLDVNNNDSSINSFWNVASGYSPSPTILHKPLNLPGNIIYIIPSEVSPFCLWQKRKYNVKYADPEDFNVILVGPAMLADHMPDRMWKALNRIQEVNKEKSRIYNI